mmetsp:Transcript_12740/g.20039  ORF Transcript_12740/g.20039 Transcript_12740/m.20039 type:complete len:628 (+) Transcript_12740:3-1886(+)
MVAKEAIGKSFDMLSGSDTDTDGIRSEVLLSTQGKSLQTSLVTYSADGAQKNNMTVEYFPVLSKEGLFDHVMILVLEHKQATEQEAEEEVEQQAEEETVVTEDVNPADLTPVAQLDKASTKDACLAEIVMQLRLELVASGVEGAVGLVDSRGKILMANESLQNLCNNHAMEGLPWPALTGDEADPDAMVELESALESGQRFDGLMNLREGSGESFWAAILSQPVCFVCKGHSFSLFGLSVEDVSDIYDSLDSEDLEMEDPYAFAARMELSDMQEMKMAQLVGSLTLAWTDVEEGAPEPKQFSELVIPGAASSMQMCIPVLWQLKGQGLVSSWTWEEDCLRLRADLSALAGSQAAFDSGKEFWMAKLFGAAAQSQVPSQHDSHVWEEEDGGTDFGFMNADFQQNTSVRSSNAQVPPAATRTSHQYSEDAMLKALLEGAQTRLAIERGARDGERQEFSRQIATLQRDRDCLWSILCNVNELLDKSSAKIEQLHIEAEASQEVSAAALSALTGQIESRDAMLTEMRGKLELMHELFEAMQIHDDAADDGVAMYFKMKPLDVAMVNSSGILHQLQGQGRVLRWHWDGTNLNLQVPSDLSPGRPSNSFWEFVAQLDSSQDSSNEGSDFGFLN